LAGLHDDSQSDAPNQIDRQIACPGYQPLPLDLQLMTKRRPHSGEQFVHPDRLRHIVIGAKIEA